MEHHHHHHHPAASKKSKTSHPQQQQQQLIQYLIESIVKQQSLHGLIELSKKNIHTHADTFSSHNVQQKSPYSDRRRKNNEAAKRSRDTRRANEDEMAIRATWLEQENIQLRLENAQLKQENLLLQCQRDAL